MVCTCWCQHVRWAEQGPEHFPEARSHRTNSLIPSSNFGTGNSMFDIIRQTEHPSLCLTQPSMQRTREPQDTHRSTQGCGARLRSTCVQSIPKKNATCKTGREKLDDRPAHICRPISSNFQSTSKTQRFQHQENSYQALVRIFCGLMYI